MCNNSETYEIIEVSSAEEYIDKFRPLGEFSKPNYIYRGCWDKDFLLLPSLYRSQIKKYLEVFIESDIGLCSLIQKSVQRYLQKYDSKERLINENHLKEVIKTAFLELILIEKFIDQSNASRLFIYDMQLIEEKVPNTIAYLRVRLDDFLKDFLERSINEQHITIDCFQNPRRLFKLANMENFALAQHHGIPTRLLDWTTNSLIACFFSVHETNTCEDNLDACVWILNTEYLDKNYSNGGVDFHRNLLKHGLEFLHLQKGVFTEMVGIETCYLECGKWPTLDIYLYKFLAPQFARDNSINLSYYLKKVILPGKYKKSVLNILNRYDINLHQLMPTYDNVADSIIKRPELY